MKTSIETINGKLCTVIFGDADVLPSHILGRRFVETSNGVLEIFMEADCLTHIATALPAFPRHPEIEDDAGKFDKFQRIRAAYRARGIIARHDLDTKTLCAITESGERVEIAIEGD